jgi:hypothetical protein
MFLIDIIFFMKNQKGKGILVIGLVLKFCNHVDPLFPSEKNDLSLK